MKERLDKIIAKVGGLSRRDAQRAIRDKRVTVNGEMCRDADRKVDTAADRITLDGTILSYREHVYYMMNKPSGVVSATEDREEKTVLELLPSAMQRSGLFPAGRLDKDTTGLLIITDDGDYAHRMLSPRRHVTKRYIATLDRDPDEKILKQFEEGITLRDGTVCKRGYAVPIGDRRVQTDISEGRYHQVKRMFAALGYEVVALRRIAIGGLHLDESLSEGEVRELTGEEAAKVFAP